MKSTPLAVLSLAAVLTCGCGTDKQPGKPEKPVANRACPVPVVPLERFDDASAEEQALHFQGAVEYAPKQYVACAYDSTGVYGRLNGTNPPQFIVISCVLMADKKLLERNFIVAHYELQPAWPSLDEATATAAQRSEGMEDRQFRWVTGPIVAQLAFTYGRTFWISWKAFGLDRPPAEGEFRVRVSVLERRGDGVSFHVNADA
jgi:hypothetical protein